VDLLLQRIDMISGRMFPLEGKLDYEPGVMQSFLVRAKQAGIRCKDPVFWAWLMEEKGYPVATEQHAAEAVRDMCGVASRSDFGKPGHSTNRALWYEADNQFQAWKARENTQ
jgi:hypothetical protein